jgi:RNA polymerase sigma factor (sigma-70 family)
MEKTSMPPVDSSPSPPADPAVADAERRALAHEVCKRHQAYIEALLARFRDVVPASGEELVQEVLLVLHAEVEATGREPEKVRGFLKQTVRYKVKNHKRLRRPVIDPGVNADAVGAASTEADPEGTAELHEQLRKVERYSRGLPQAQVDVLRCTLGAGMSLDETAEALGRPRATVYDQLQAAKATLRARAQDSERAAAERADRGEG